MKTFREILGKQTGVSLDDEDMVRVQCQIRDIEIASDIYATQFNRWIPVDEFDGHEGKMVIVKGILCSELGYSTGPSIGFVIWRNKDYSECVDSCYYSMWYTNITEVFPIYNH